MSVFNKNRPCVQTGFTIGHTLGRRAVKGDIGLEIEVEGNKFQKSNVHLLPLGWQHHTDNSLRGTDNAEYVLNGPIKFDQVRGHIDALWDMFKAYGSKISESNRTSVHVHLNVQDFYFDHFAAFAALYFCFEEILTEWCGEHRVGNLFCLRAKDAPAIITAIKRFIRTDGGDIRENFHYAGFNPQALFKFGSIEIRTLRGTPDPEVIFDWVGILRRLYELSGSYSDPRDVCSNFSAEGPIAFFETILGEHASKVRAGSGMSDEKIRDSLYEGIRLAQDIAYCRDWGVYKKTEVKKDPFNRDAMKQAKKVSTYQNAQSLQATHIDDYPPPPPPVPHPSAYIEPTTWGAEGYTQSASNFTQTSAQAAAQTQIINGILAGNSFNTQSIAPQPIVTTPAWPDVDPQPTEEEWSNDLDAF